LILDLVILGELCSRIKIRDHAKLESQFVSCKSVLSLLSYLCKAPLVPKGTQVVNSLFRQRAAIENILRACVGLPPNNHMSLEQRFDFSSISVESPSRKAKVIAENGMKMNGNTNGFHHEVNGHNGHSKEIFVENGNH